MGEQEADEFLAGLGRVCRETVRAARNGDELRPRDGAGQKSTVVERQDPIVVAMDHERGSGDRG